jgi:hypothetical protein
LISILCLCCCFRKIGRRNQEEKYAIWNWWCSESLDASWMIRAKYILLIILNSINYKFSIDCICGYFHKMCKRKLETACK